MTVLAASLVIASGFASSSEGAKPEPRPDRPPTAVDREIDRAREKVFACQDALGLDRSSVSNDPVVGPAYARWVLALWRSRVEAFCGLSRSLSSTTVAIRVVFRERAPEALAVARCESGLDTRAANGQYRGLFQMGASERRIYGHGASALEQARAARRYFVASGSDWSPWQCRPWGLAWS